MVRGAGTEGHTMTDLIRNAPAKPRKGTALLAKRKARKDWKAAEDAVMRQAKRRDGGKCRFPRCEFAKSGMVIHAAHLVHRGAGGNPSLSRTTPENVVALCARHHQLLDLGHVRIECLTDKGASGPCAWYFDGQHIATESIIGVSVARGVL